MWTMKESGGAEQQQQQMKKQGKEEELFSYIILTYMILHMKKVIFLIQMISPIETIKRGLPWWSGG